MLSDKQQQTTFCHVCYADNSNAVNPIVLDTVINDGSWICAACWISRTHQNPDVQFVLAILNRFIDVMVQRNFHHTLSEWSKAVLSLRSCQDMKRFFRGYAYWRIGPQIPPDVAAQEAKDNIGCPLNDAGWWTRFKWWYACRIVRSDIFHY